MNPTELANLAITVYTLQMQLAQAQQNISHLLAELQGAKTAYDDANSKIYRFQSQMQGNSANMSKLRKPISFTEKDTGSIISWTTHMENFQSYPPGTAYFMWPDVTLMTTHMNGRTFIIRRKMDRLPLPGPN